MKGRNIFFAILLTAATAAILPGVAQAQEVNRRLDRQMNRIHQGVEHGRLTGNQARNLHRRDEAIHARERADRAHDHGRLTERERHNLNRSLNHTSRAIYRDKHDAAARGH